MLYFKVQYVTLGTEEELCSNQVVFTLPHSLECISYSDQSVVTSDSSNLLSLSDKSKKGVKEENEGSLYTFVFISLVEFPFFIIFHLRINFNRFKHPKQLSR